ncbi:MAG: hypothetical protein ACBZ72_09465 [Candidatus Bathyarchaeia archaeon]|jgi:hypothetical protein
MRKTLIVIAFMLPWSALTAVALLFGFTYNWPDFVHVDYGLPLTWATNTLSTFAEPANAWSVDISALAVDLVFWLGIMTAAVAVLLYKLKP